MRTVFFGTPDYVLPILDALKNAGHEIAAVVTQPAKPIGRRKTSTSSPTALWAKKYDIKILDGKPKEIVEELKKLEAEVGVLAAYGRILPPELLTVFPHGILNIHPSLLPKYRGASPVQAAIAVGEKQTGVTIIKLDEEVDHGPVVLQFTEDIKEDDTAGTLRERLFQMAAETLPEILYRYIAMKIKPQEQNHTKATYTTLLKKEYGFIPPHYLAAALQGVPLQGVPLQKEWQIPFLKDYCPARPEQSRGMPSSPRAKSRNAQCLVNFIRAMDPWPGAWTEVKVKGKTQTFVPSSGRGNAKRLKILKAHIEPSPPVPSAQLVPSEVEGCLVPDLVQLEGKKPVSWEEFKKGYPQTNFG